jgi:pyruvate/2-oxoglutarate dehydrogenase complex dihydrolipoamide acyltransferase (E2) component
MPETLRPKGVAVVGDLVREEHVQLLVAVLRALGDGEAVEQLLGPVDGGELCVGDVEHHLAASDPEELVGEPEEGGDARCKARLRLHFPDVHRERDAAEARGAALVAREAAPSRKTTAETEAPRDPRTACRVASPQRRQRVRERAIESARTPCYSRRATSGRLGARGFPRDDATLPAAHQGASSVP